MCLGASYKSNTKNKKIFVMAELYYIYHKHSFKLMYLNITVVN